MACFHRLWYNRKWKKLHLVIIPILCIVREIHCYHFVLIVQSAIGSVMLLLLFQLPCTTRIMIWGQVAQVPSCQGVDKGGRTVHLRGRASSWHRAIFGRVPQRDVGGLHCLFILQWMFIHATETRQKEADRLIHHSHWQSLPKLDSGLDISAIQLVGYWTASEEIRDLYCQVYALKCLSRPPACGPERAWEIMKDNVSSLKDCLRWRKGKQSGGCGEPESASTYPSSHCDWASQRGRWDTSGEWELAKAGEGHQWALAAATALEECIERLSQSTTSMWLDVHHCSQSQDQPRRRSWGWSHKHHRVPLEEGLPSLIPFTESHWLPSKGHFPGPRNDIRRRTSTWAGLCWSWSGALYWARAGAQALPAGASHHARGG